ncbi:MAG: sigma-70 family RNA polymerase sigma factor [Pirellulaceae bacterium]|nr:sigma-70 family RNA polymerase sigma factor [Pirellulaceae bacterium]
MTSEHDPHLSRITTIWTDVLEAHGANQSAARAAQQAVLERYSVAIHRYLCKVLGDPDAADEVFQQFALQFVRQAFRNADPGRGRFRDYVKISVLNLVHRYRRGQRARPPGLDLEQLPEQTANLDFDDEAALAESVRDELLARAWRRLEQLEATTGTPYHRVLALRAADPEATSDQLAERLNAARPGEPTCTPANARKLLERARLQLATYVLDEVARTLDSPDPQELRDEVRELGLYAYCRRALERK